MSKGVIRLFSSPSYLQTANISSDKVSGNVEILFFVTH